MYGLDEYAYGFRNYYATIGRFETIDPLAEGNLSISPYAYASNNFIDRTDWMGLASTFPYKQEYVAIDKEGRVIGYDVNSEDHHVYRVDENWDGTYESLQKYPIIGWEIPGYKNYSIGHPCYFIGNNSSSYIDFGNNLRFGNEYFDDTINITSTALLHYLFGDGEDKMNGKFALFRLFQNPKFVKFLFEFYIDRKTSPKTQSMVLNMTFIPTQFHIGHTTLAYYSVDSRLIMGYGINDGFGDANFVHEFLYEFTKIHHGRLMVRDPI